MRRNALQILMTAVLAFAFTGAFAQGTDLPGDGANLATNWADNTAEPTTHMIEGQTVPLFAMPDAYYHPSYDASTETYTLTAGFEWHWSVSGVVGGGVVGDITFSQNGVEDNYVEVTGGVAGSTYSIDVYEQAPDGLGGCQGSTQSVDVIVHAEPSVTLGGDNAFEGCEGSTGAPATINATISEGWQNYRLVWSLEIATLDDASAKEFYYDDENGTNPTGAQKYAAEFTPASPDAVAAAGDHDITTVSDYLVINNGTRDAVTVYTYTLTSINDQASRFGDFISLGGDASAPENFTYFANNETITVTVYPAPTTGPIYHISNSWAQ